MCEQYDAYHKKELAVLEKRKENAIKNKGYTEERQDKCWFCDSCVHRPYELFCFEYDILVSPFGLCPMFLKRKGA